MSQSTAKPLRNTEVLTQSLQDELVIYDLGSTTAHSLESTLASVWQMCDGETEIQEMAQKLGVTEDLIGLAVRRLERAGLLTSARIPWQLSTSRRALLQGSAALGGLAIASALLPTAAGALSKQKCTAPCVSKNHCGPAGSPGCTSGICCCSYRSVFTKKGTSVLRFKRCVGTSRCANSYVLGGTVKRVSKCL